MPQQYLDANGNPVAAPTKVYLDPSTGEAQGSAASASTQAAPTADTRSWWQRAKDNINANTQGSTPGEYWHNPVKAAAEDVGAGGGDVLRAIAHPLNTLQGMVQSTQPDNGTAGAVETLMGPGGPFLVHNAEALAHNPARFAGQVGLGTILGHAAAPVVDAPVNLAGKMARGGADIIAGTGTGAAEGLADQTQAANVKAQADADAANAKITSARAKQLQQHFQQTQASKQVPTPNLPPDTGLPPETTKVRTPQELQSQKTAIGRGVEQQAPQFQEDLRTTEKNVRAQAGANYDAVREATAGATVPASSLTDAVRQAETNIEGSSENLKVFRDILSKSPAPDDFVVSGGAKFGPGTALYDSVKASPEGMPGAGATTANFSDLQGYYTELGSQLSKGNLPADVYRATKSLQGSIGDLMQQMAESKGVGDQLTKARGFYSDYMNAFRDSSSPIYKAMNSAEPEGAVKAFKNASSSGVETLGRYNSDLAQQANRLRNLNTQATTIKPGTAPKPPAPLPPPKPPVLADVKKVGLGDIQQANTDALNKRADTFAKKASLVSGGFGGYELLRGAMHGSPTAMALGAGEIAAPYVLSKVITNPIVERWLTKPTPAQIAAIPPDIRGNLPQIVKAAQAQGIAVHPAILSLAGVTQRAQ